MSTFTFYDEDRGCVVFWLGSGPLSQKAASYLSTAIWFGEKYNCRKLLVDTRKGEMDLNVDDLGLLADKLAHGGLDQSWRRAVVSTAPARLRDFYEAYNKKRGYPVRVFISENEAVSWLKRKHAS